MKRELKLWVIEVPEHNCAIALILTQTHRCGEFAHGDKQVFGAASGICLESVSCPQYYASGHRVCLHGSNRENDCTPLRFPLDALPHLEAAVREYNETNGGEYPRKQANKSLASAEEFVTRTIE